MAWSQPLVRVEKLSIDTSITKTTKDSAKADTSSADSVDWNSRSFKYNLELEQFSLMGTALLKYHGAVLRADTINLDNQNEFVTAIGHPRIQDRSEPEISGYRLRYNHKKRVGEMYYGSTQRDGQSFNGVEVRRQQGGGVMIARGDFSSCDNLEDQHFYFYSRRLVLEPNEKVLARPVVLNIGGVPMAVVPMVVVPLGKGRRSGFIKPKIGGDQQNGFYIQDIGYYWAINDYLDFKTLGDLVEGTRGTFDDANLEADLQYSKRLWLNGDISGRTYLQEFNPGNSGWEINFKHDQRITPDGKKMLVGNGRIVSSSQILDKALNEEQAIQQTANARLGYSHQLDWNKARLNVSASQDYNLGTEKQERELPHASFNYSAPLVPIETNDYWDASGDALDDTKWYEKWNYSVGTEWSAYTLKNPKDTSAINDSLTFVGSKNSLGLSGKYSLLEYFNLTPALDYANYWSLHSYTSPRQGLHRNENPAEAMIHKGNASLTLDTKLYGIANPNIGRFQKIRHTVSPSVNYVYTPRIRDDSLFAVHPKFPVSLGQEKAQTVGLSLGNDIDIKVLQPDTGKDKKEKSQSYKPLSANTSVSYNFEADGRKVSDIPLSLRSEIIKNHNLSLNMNYRPYDDYTDSAHRNTLTTPILMSWSTGWRQDISLGGKMSSGVFGESGPIDRKAWSGGMAYSFEYRANRVSKTTFQRSLSHALDGNLKFKPTPGWDVAYETAFDFNKGGFSRHSFNITRELHCWRMVFNWRPVGIGAGWDFRIFIIDIPDIKIESGQNNIRRASRK